MRAHNVRPGCIEGPQRATTVGSTNSSSDATVSGGATTASSSATSDAYPNYYPNCYSNYSNSYSNYSNGYSNQYSNKYSEDYNCYKDPRKRRGRITLFKLLFTLLSYTIASTISTTFGTTISIGKLVSASNIPINEGILTGSDELSFLESSGTATSTFGTGNRISSNSSRSNSLSSFLNITPYHPPTFTNTSTTTTSATNPRDDFRNRRNHVVRHRRPHRSHNSLTSLFNKSFLQLTNLLSNKSTLGSGKNSRRGGNRRSSKKKSRGEEDEKRSKWSEYMAKFDIAKVHGSGVYVDLGGSATVGSYDYRMPTGKCPVVGKAIVLENGADFLKSITHHDPKERGLSFPPTKVSSNSSKVDMENQLLSPISAQLLRSLNYKHESDLSNCAEYSKNIIPGSNRNSRYRYPFVYDSKDKQCYILYSPMQYNQGVKYCDTDSSEEGTSSLACMYPDKDKEDSHLFYGTSNLHMDWSVVCPIYPIKDSIFGTYDVEKDECTPIEPMYTEEAEDYAECNKILFEYSPSDVDISSNNQILSDVERYKEALKGGKLSTALSIMFAPRYAEDRPIYTRGVGINWATYDVNKRVCNILDVVPTCLIISNGYYSLSSLSSPNEEDAVPYPCDIVHSKGFLSTTNKKNKEGGKEKEKEKEKEEKENEKSKEGKEKEEKEATPAPTLEEFIPYTSLLKEGFKCDKNVHVVTNGSCGTYFECSTRPVEKVGGFKTFYYIIIAVVAVIVLGGLGYYGYYYYNNRKKFKRYESEKYDQDTLYDSDLEYYNGEHHREHGPEREVRGDGGIWSRNEPNNSDVTPIRISKIERHP